MSTCQPDVPAQHSRLSLSVLLSASWTRFRKPSQISGLTYILQTGPLISELRMSSELEAQFVDADVNFQTKIHVRLPHLYSGLAYIIH